MLDSSAFAAVPLERPSTTGWQRSVALLAAVYFGCLSSFFLLLAAGPLYLSEQPGGGTTPGLATGALMLTSTVTGLATPYLGSRLGYRALLLAGLLLMGSTSLIWLSAPNSAALVAASVVRGVGFAVVVVGVGSVASWLLPPGRRGQGMSLLGIVSTFTALIGLPVGVWLAQTAGFGTVFTLAAGLPLLAAFVPLLFLALPKGTASVWLPTDLAAARVLWRPALALSVNALLSGVMITHLPPVAGGAAVTGLLAYAAALAVGRWLAARWCDARGQAPGWVQGVVSLLGVVGIVLTGSVLPAVGATGAMLPVAGAGVLGFGFGVVQSVTLAAMLEQLPPTTVGAANAVWDAAYDIGWAGGAAAVGVVIGSSGYGAGAITAAAVALAATTITAFRARPDRRPHG